ncbi:MAG: hypothetical protein AAGJ73_14615 [Pseudomonadota bacterium]
MLSRFNLKRGFAAAAFSVVSASCAAEDRADVASSLQSDRGARAPEYALPQVTITAYGTKPKVGSGSPYIADCDGAVPDDDLEVLTFYAPWEVKNPGSGGSGAKDGVTPFSRSFDLEKRPAVQLLRLRLSYSREKRDAAVENLTEGYAPVALVDFGPHKVGVYFSENETGNIRRGYTAFFPLVELSSLPAESSITDRIIAEVSISHSSKTLDGWHEAEILNVFKSLYQEKCLSEALASSYAVFSPKVILE